MSRRRVLFFGLVSGLMLTLALAPSLVLAQGGSGRGGKGGAAGYGSARGTKMSGSANYRGGLGQSSGRIVGGTLDPQEEQALLMAIDDEYKALATYLGVMEQFGEVSPFTYIARAEEQHIAALARLFTRYGLAIPEHGWQGNAPAFGSVTEACAAGVQAEIDNAGLYDQLFSMVDNPDIVRVFTNLRNASEYNHLPAFSSCANATS